MQRFLLFLLALALSFVIGINVFRSFMPKEEATLTQPLSELLPEHIEGWQSKEVPLASTPEGEESVFRILHYDDVITREYTKGNTKVLVYVAYWKPGSYAYHFVTTHNPDSCWVNSGWERLDRKYEQQTYKTQLGYLKATEWGKYKLNHSTSEVIFWHLVGGEPYHMKMLGWDNGKGFAFKRRFFFINDLMEFGLDLNREQFFVRVSSNQKIDVLWSDPDFQKIIESLRFTGVFKEDSEVLDQPFNGSSKKDLALKK